MNPKKNTVAVTFRCDVAVADQLDELCRMMGIKRSEFLFLQSLPNTTRCRGTRS